MRRAYDDGAADQAIGKRPLNRVADRRIAGRRIGHIARDKLHASGSEFFEAGEILSASGGQKSAHLIAVHSGVANGVSHVDGEEKRTVPHRLRNLDPHLVVFAPSGEKAGLFLSVLDDLGKWLGRRWRTGRRSSRPHTGFRRCGDRLRADCCARIGDFCCSVTGGGGHSSGRDRGRGRRRRG